MSSFCLCALTTLEQPERMKTNARAASASRADRRNRYFQESRITFLQIYDIIEDALQLDFDYCKTPTLDEILDVEKKVYEYISSKY